MLVSWSAQDNGPGLIYQAVFSSGVSPSTNGLGLNQASVTANAFAPFSGLVRDTSYYAEVRAFNNNGVPTAYASLGSTATGPSLTVRARATIAGGVGPSMQVLVGGVRVGSVEVKSTTYADFAFPLSASVAPGARVDVVFTNDGSVNGADRNLYVDYLTFSGRTIYTSDSSVYTYSDTPQYCSSGYQQSGALYCAGYLEYPTASAVVAQFQDKPASVQSLSAILIYPNPFRADRLFNLGDEFFGNCRTLEI